MIRKVENAVEVSLGREDVAVHTQVTVQVVTVEAVTQLVAEAAAAAVAVDQAEVVTQVAAILHPLVGLEEEDIRLILRLAVEAEAEVEVEKIEMIEVPVPAVEVHVPVEAIHPRISVHRKEMQAPVEA